MSLGLALSTVQQIATALPTDHTLPDELERARTALLGIDPDLSRLMNEALALHGAGSLAEAARLSALDQPPAHGACSSSSSQASSASASAPSW